ncbi:Sec-independent protein translocase protein TatB [Pantoea ananatis]|uniref:Sec-independent protein translocase protein TatB n=1 Tax=Pantoea ananas TaxID=553 RepID=UPI000DA69FD1|nr:Sec-independent protein translocase protein TatB [Pantoea ananatis]MDS7718951.1 Sec-independent protein translocase protein TatB [Pantoea ananatis]PZD62402.1 twin-arginine translocase subunit TatB [Pantoea ananatis]
MFDIGFGELVLVFVIGLIVLGPQRLPHAVKTVVGWIRAIRSLAANVQSELAQELKLQELQDSLKKVEEAGRGTLSPELKESMEELRKTADSMKRSVRQSIDIERDEDEANTIHSPHPVSTTETLHPVTPAASEHQAQAPVQAPLPTSEPAASQPADSRVESSPDQPRPVSGHASAPPQSPAHADVQTAARPVSAVSPAGSVSTPSASDER